MEPHGAIWMEIKVQVRGVLGVREYLRFLGVCRYRSRIRGIVLSPLQSRVDRAEPLICRVRGCPVEFSLHGVGNPWFRVICRHYVIRVHTWVRTAQNKMLEASGVFNLAKYVLL
jgi:hypothetical protein